MDVYKFINSKDIREYLKKINYEFTPVEATWLIWQCEHVTLKEKQNAWQKMIDTMQDCPIDCSFKKINSLHKFLKDTIALENKTIETFTKNEKDTIYNFYINFSYAYDYNHKKYSTYDDMLKDIKNVAKNYKRKISDFNLCKEYPNKNNLINLFMHPNFEIKSVESEELHDKIDSIFMDMCFSFPTPFKQGDIVCLPNDVIDSNRKPQVITFEGKAISQVKIDASIPVYRQESYGDGSVFLDFIPNYMDLEYYHGEFDGQKKIIKALSNYLKGKIDISLFANSYHYCLTESYLNRNCSTKRQAKNYSDEDLFLAGLKEKEDE